MDMTPIGTFHCSETHPYDSARQGRVAGENVGTVVLEAGKDYEQGLRELEGFSHVWLVYVFHQNPHWKPMVNPPRLDRKVGVFATRAPYRPNPIGLTCVRLVSVEGLKLTVRGHDLLDGTPILDIKPYLPYADAVSDARAGWVSEAELAGWNVSFSPEARSQLDWLAERGVTTLEGFLTRQLSHRPLDGKKKRVHLLEDGVWELAYRTWRARFTADEASSDIAVERLYSGYSDKELADDTDPYEDKAVHREFQSRAK